jgi:hypothetical protein
MMRTVARVARVVRGLSHQSFHFFHRKEKAEGQLFVADSQRPGIMCSEHWMGFGGCRWWLLPGVGGHWRFGFDWRWWRRGFAKSHDATKKGDAKRNNERNPKMKKKQTNCHFFAKPSCAARDCFSSTATPDARGIP